MNNEDYLIWESRCAPSRMGSSRASVYGMPTNTITANADGNLLLPSPTPMPVSGNCFWVRHADVLVLYAHLQAGLFPRPF